MKAFERILVPLDFSDDSRGALVMAGDLAEQGAGQLVIVHVLDMPSDFVEDLDLTLPTKLTEGQQLARVTQRIDEIARQSLPPTVAWTTHLEIGQPALKIVEAAERERADLIVMGTVGRTGLAQLLLGSVAERVVRLATCPVLTLRKSIRPDVVGSSR